MTRARENARHGSAAVREVGCRRGRRGRTRRLVPGAIAQGASKTLKFGNMLPPDQVHHKAHRTVRRGTRQTLQQHDQARHLPELADGQHSRDAAVARRPARCRCRWRCRPVFELHEAARRLYAAVPRRQRGQAPPRARWHPRPRDHQIRRARRIQGAGLPAPPRRAASSTSSARSTSRRIARA